MRMEDGDMKNKSITNSLLTAMAMFLIAVNGWAQDNSHDTGSEYQTNSTMNCGAVNVRVVTYCELGKNQNPNCFLQKVAFTNSLSKESSSKLYLYENYKKDMSLICFSCHHP